MIFSERLGLVFIHIPKTAGTSISEALYAADTEAVRRLPKLSRTKHYLARDVRRAITPEKFDSLFSFAVTRDPFDRFCSIYFFVRGRPGLEEQMAGIGSIDAFADLWDQSDSWIKGLHSARCQREFLVASDGVNLVSRTFRFDALDEMTEELSDRIGRPVALQHSKPGSWTRDDPQLASPYWRRIVERHYADDMCYCTSM
jgi:hypothetical protein